MSIVVALVTLAIALPALARNARVALDVPYAGPASDPLQRLDILPPPACPDAGCPVLMFVHGGGWQRGDKKRTLPVGRTYAEAGIVFVGVNYRLSPAVQHPAHVADVATAIAWVRDNIRSYGGNPDRIVLMGHSAGAHLVSLVITDPQYLAPHGLSAADIAGVVPLDTATYDLLFFASDDHRAAASREEDGRTPMKPMAFTDSPEAWKAASPFHAIRSGAGYPPFLIVYCAHRVRDAAPESEKFAAALRSAGTRVETMAVPDRTHVSILAQQRNRDDPVTRAVIAFVTGPGG